jgi:hypothetical protein
MLTNEQQEFYQRWMTKGGAGNPENIAKYIDKYVTLFITYNALYYVIPRKLLAAGHHVISTQDKEGAITNVPRMITAAEL